MFPSWLTSKEPSTDSANERHAVLGTALRAPLLSDQEEAIFACGCFWGAEKGFWRLPGVVSTAVGYAGGQNQNPSYQEVCSGRTGHTEVVRVVWSTPAIDFSDLLKLFWECHDPTQGDRQGNDTGTQYPLRCLHNNSATDDSGPGQQGELPKRACCKRFRADHNRNQGRSALLLR